MIQDIPKVALGADPVTIVFMIVLILTVGYYMEKR